MSASIFLLVACLRVSLCVCVCMCYVRPECACEPGVCKYFLTGCLLAYVFVCVCVYVCACVRRHSSTLAGTRRYSYTPTCLERASRSHVRKVPKTSVLARTSFKNGGNSISKLEILLTSAFAAKRVFKSDIYYKPGTCFARLSWSQI